LDNEMLVLGGVGCWWGTDHEQLCTICCTRELTCSQSLSQITPELVPSELLYGLPAKSKVQTNSLLYV